MRNINREIYQCLLWLALGSVGFLLSYQFNVPISGYRYGATGWPRVVFGIMVFFALMQLICGLFSERAKGSVEVKEELPIGSSESNHIILSKAKRLISFSLPILYVFLLPRAGFYVLTPFFVGLYMFVLGERRILHLVITVLLVLGTIYLIFTWLLFVPFPVGNWPFCYELNCMLVSALSGGSH